MSMDAPLSFTVPTEVEWRRPAGTVLRRAVMAPGMVYGGLLPIMETYNIYARPYDGSADWTRLYEIDAAARTVQRWT